MAKQVSLSNDQIAERADYCSENDLCFISKEPIADKAISLQTINNHLVLVQQKYTPEGRRADGNGRKNNTTATNTSKG